MRHRDSHRPDALRSRRTLRCLTRLRRTHFRSRLDFTTRSSTQLAQVRNLFARSTCGTARVQHLLQTICPSITSPLTTRVDRLTEQSIASTMGIGANELDAFSYKQSCLSICFGGFCRRFCIVSLLLPIHRRNHSSIPRRCNLELGNV
jgi:hypothetical protein